MRHSNRGAVPRAGELPAAAVPPGRRPAVHRRPHRGRHRPGAGRRRRLAGPDLLPAGHPVGLPGPGPQRRPLLPGRRRPPDRPPRWRGGRARAPPRPAPTARPASACPRRSSPTWPAPSGAPWTPGPSRRWLWKGRRVYLFDGTTVTMPDTPENQAAYPQVYNQKPGLGFPIARIGAVISLACGAVVNLGFCRYAGKGQGEVSLLRRLWDVLAPRRRPPGRPADSPTGRPSCCSRSAASSWSAG